MPIIYQEFRERLVALAQPGFRFLDATKIFDDCGSDVDLFIDSAHFGDRGNDRIAQFLCAPVMTVLAERSQRTASANTAPHYQRG